MPFRADDVDSSDEYSSLDSDSDYESEEDRRLRQLEWDESMQQLQSLVSLILLPFLGKWLGRKMSYILYNRYLTHGLGLAFLTGRVSR